MHDFKKYPALHALGHALLAVSYIAIVAWLLSNGEQLFGPDEPKNLWIPVFMLLLFVLSATITGALVLGRPILLYIDGQKKEALAFFGYTVLWLFVILAAGLVIQPWR